VAGGSKGAEGNMRKGDDYKWKVERRKKMIKGGGTG